MPKQGFHMSMTNVARSVFLVRANPVFIGIRYKHLEYMMSEASPLYTRNDAVIQPSRCAIGFARQGLRVYNRPSPESQTVDV